MTKRFSAFIAMFAFFVVCLCGLATGATVEQVCLRAVVAMAMFFFLGVLLGGIANRIILENKYVDDKKNRLSAKKTPMPEGAKDNEGIESVVQSGAE